MVLGMSPVAFAKKKSVEVVFMTTPFGSALYNLGAAFEQVFKKRNSWVKIKHQETPGDMYLVRFFVMNQGKIASGKMTQRLVGNCVCTINHVNGGQPPLDKYPLKDSRGIFSSPSFISFHGSFDPSIKNHRDLAGKRVGTAEKARIFSWLLNNKPYFGKGLGIWDKIKWANLGEMGSKDAMLNNKIEVTSISYQGSVSVDKNGNYFTTGLAPVTPTLELLNSGRKVHYIPYDAKVIKKSYDPVKDMLLFPILIKKGADVSIKKDIMGIVAIGAVTAMKSMSNDVVEEIIRIRHKYRKDFANYHAVLKYMPENPYPLGTPKKWVHTGVKKAMKKLRIPLPPGV